MTKDTENGNGRLKLPWSVVIQFVSWLVAALVTYGAVNARVAVLETRQHITESRLERIEHKIDALLDRR